VFLMSEVPLHRSSGEGVKIYPQRSLRQVLGCYGRTYEPTRHGRDTKAMPVLIKVFSFLFLGQHADSDPGARFRVL
jgi:hypothetical protein